MFNYWGGIDQKFSTRISTRNLVYADGHHSVGTSNHGSVANFLLAMRASDNRRDFCKDISASDNEACSQSSNDSPADVDYLHVNPKNVSGFGYRKANGILAGEDFVTKINNKVILIQKFKK